MEEDGGRWKKMDEKKSSKKVEKQCQKKIVWKVPGMVWGPQLGYKQPQKIFWALGYDFFEKKKLS